MSEWISVLDRLPEPGERVLATNGVFVGEAWIGERSRWTRPTGFSWAALQSKPVTHWKPMPIGPDYAIVDTATIQLAADPRKIECPFCGKSWIGFKYNAADPRKQMLDEIRERINNLCEYKSFVRVEGDPVPTLPQIAKWCVIWILDEMEAKL